MMSFDDFTELYFDKARNKAKNDSTVLLCCKESQRFLWWFENKYLKWGYDKADTSDVENLYNSLTAVLKGADNISTVISKLSKTSEYLNTQKIVLVYGELCRQANKHGDVNFSARLECAKELTKQGVKVKAFGRYSKQGTTILAHVKQENKLLANGWTKLC